MKAERQKPSKTEKLPLKSYGPKESKEKKLRKVMTATWQMYRTENGVYVCDKCPCGGK
jgi:hypothetical protein